MAQTNFLGLALIFLGVAAIAAFIWRIARRWRIETLPPTCRKCGYDVSKRPTGVETCSECGADLAAPNAIITRRRTINRWLSIPAAMTMGVALMLASVLLWNTPWFNLYLQHAPVAMLAWQARHDHSIIGDTYRRAWAARRQDAAYYDHLLSLQTESIAPTYRQLSDELDIAFDRNTLTASQRACYAKQVFGRVKFRIRSPVRVGDPLPIEATMENHAGVAHLWGERITLAAQVDGDAILKNRFWSLGSLTEITQRTLPPNGWGGETLTPGTHQLTIKLRREMASHTPATTRPDGDALAPPVDVATTLPIEVLPARTPIGAPVEKPELGQAIGRSIDLHVYHWFSDKQIFAEIRFFPVNCDRAFKVVATVDGNDCVIGSIAIPAGQSGTTDSLYVPVPDSRAATLPSLAFKLIGSGDALVSSIDQQQFWAGEIDFDDVTLETIKDFQNNARTRPTTPTSRPFRVDPIRR